MAELSREGDELVLTLSTAEKAESLHGDIRVPLSSVREVEVVEDVVHAVHAFAKLVGAAWPGRFEIGTFAGDGGRVFAVVHHATPRGVRVRLEGEHFSELVVGVEEPEATARSLGAASGSGGWDAPSPEA